MRPEYCEPAVVFNSTVAFRVLTLEANALYFSSSSSRVATLATGRAWAGTFCFLVTPLLTAQPPEMAASVATAIHEFAHRAKRIPLVGCLVSVQAVLRKLIGKSGVIRVHADARAKAESFRFEPLEEL